jgi:signal transduction histidine kinase/ActR/RegA family two-component response regulator
VLVIDDEKVLRSLLTETLTADGFDVAAVDSGQSALEMLKYRKFDLALTDLKMPGMDGIETLRALREADRELQVVVMTGYGTLETAIGAIQGGAYDYIQKPFHSEDLAPMVRRAMERTALERLIATYGASRVLIASLGHPELCRLVMDLAEGLFRADAVGLLVRDPRGDEIEVHRRGAGSLPSDDLLFSMMRQSEKLGRPFSLPPDEEDVEDLLAPVSDEFCAALIYPLMEGLDPFGAICVLRHRTTRSFSAGELQRGILFASEVSRALIGAQLHERLKERAAEVERLRSQLEKAHRTALEGRLVSGLARDFQFHARRVRSGAHFLRDAFADFASVISSYQALRASLAGGKIDSVRLREVDDAEEEADIGYLLEQTPRAIHEAMEGATDVGEVMEGIRKVSGPAGAGKASMDLNGLLDAVIEIVQPDLDPLAELEVERGEISLVPCVPCDVSLVFLCLLMNAAEAIRSVVGNSEQRGRLVVRTAMDGEAVTVAISDNGCGIPDRLKERIFDPFFTTRENGRANGLGLPLARHIVEGTHGGSLTFESSPGEGTTFLVRLPL